MVHHYFCFHEAGVKKVADLALLLIKVLPNSASYSNKADDFMQSWRREMYGENWGPLFEVQESYVIIVGSKESIQGQKLGM
jgi:hypothetical protein